MIAGKINQVSPFKGRFSYGPTRPRRAARRGFLSLSTMFRRDVIRDRSRRVPRRPSFSLPFDYPGTSISCAPKSMHFLLGLFRTNPFDPLSSTDPSERRGLSLAMAGSGVETPSPPKKRCTSRVVVSRESGHRRRTHLRTRKPSKTSFGTLRRTHLRTRKRRKRSFETRYRTPSGEYENVTDAPLKRVADPSPDPDCKKSLITQDVV